MPKESPEPDVNEVFEATLAGVTDLARNAIGGALIEAKYDVKNFLETIRDDMDLWLQELSTGKLSHDDFPVLLRAKAESAEMKLLTEAGVPIARIERFRENLVEMMCRIVRAKTAEV